MSDDSLAGAREKLRRADFHITSLNKQIDAFWSRKPFQVAVDPQPDGLQYFYRLVVRDALPANQFGLIVGDIVHNLRSALDHISWALSMCNTPELSFDNTEVQFPIFLTESGFQHRGETRIKYMGPNAKAVIRAIQPYHRSLPRLHNLWILSSLDNIDKHKIIPVVAGTIQRGKYRGKGIPIPPGKTVNVEGTLLPLEHNMVFQKVTLSGPDQNFDPRFDATFQVMFGDIPISEPDARLYVPETLDNLRSAVYWTLERFAPAFLSGSYDDSALVPPVQQKGPAFVPKPEITFG